MPKIFVDVRLDLGYAASWPSRFHFNNDDKTSILLDGLRQMEVSPEFLEEPMTSPEGGRKRIQSNTCMSNCTTHDKSLFHYWSSNLFEISGDGLS
uniref:Uncharacterized protein n=1 Tax=Solanum lycopersicum TaxID=4081 RepID=A0A3Q7FEQ8_SOLLC